MEVSSACYRGRSHLKNLGMSRSEQMITAKGKCCLNYPSGFYWGGGWRGRWGGGWQVGYSNLFSPTLLKRISFLEIHSHAWFKKRVNAFWGNLEK